MAIRLMKVLADWSARSSSYCSLLLFKYQLMIIRHFFYLKY